MLSKYTNICSDAGLSFEAVMSGEICNGDTKFCILITVRLNLRAFLVKTKVCSVVVARGQVRRGGLPP